MKGFLLGLRRTAERVPIYGPLLVVRWPSFRDGAKELGVATVFSLLPIWLYPSLLWLADQPFWETVRSCVVRGELYLYSAALLGPLIYSVSKRYGPSDDDNSESSEPRQRGFSMVLSFRFPYEGLFSVISLLVCTMAGTVYAWMQASAQGLISLQINEEQTLQASVLLYCFTLSCMFCVLVYRLDLEDIPARFTDDTGGLLSQWRERS